MALVASSQPNKAFKIRVRSLDFLVQNVGPFTTPSRDWLSGLCDTEFLSSDK
jgi:hypothetical protein